MRGGRRGLRAALAARRARPRHRPHPPGAVALPAPLRGRERADGHRAVAARAVGPRARPAAGRARCWPSSATPTSIPTRVVGRLPIGARQVVEICRAIAARARVVLMDEPTSSLPRRRRGAALRAHRPARRRRASPSSTSATSSRRRARSPPRYTVLRDGRTVGTGALADVTQRPAHRADGGPHRERALPAPRAAAGRRRGARGRGPRRPGPAGGLVQPAPGRGARDLRPHGLRPDRDGAGALRPGPARGRERERPRARAARSPRPPPRGSRTASAT